MGEDDGGEDEGGVSALDDGGAPEESDGGDENESGDKETLTEPPGASAEYRDKDEASSEEAKMGCACSSVSPKPPYGWALLFLATAIGLCRREP